jgi:hypothetical protein
MGVIEVVWNQHCKQWNGRASGQKYGREAVAAEIKERCMLKL